MTKWTRETWWILYGGDVKGVLSLIAFFAFAYAIS